MVFKTTTRRVLFQAYAIGLVLNLTACSAKGPSVGTSTSKDLNTEDVGGVSGKNNGPRQPEDTGEIDSTIGEIATNIPKSPDPKGGMTPDDEIITPPVPQTGSPGDNENKDKERTVKDGIYFIKAAGSLKCLSLPGNKKDAGIQLEQRACDKKSSNQKFEVEYLVSEKAYYITSKLSDKVLEVRDQTEVAQAAVQQGQNFGMKYQMFNFEESDGKYRIKTKVKGLFVNVAGASVDNGALIQLWHEGNVTSSTWILEPSL